MAAFEPKSAPGMNDPALYMAAVDFSEKRVEFWEQQVHAFIYCSPLERLTRTDKL